MNEAKGLRCQTESLETSLMAIFWGFILGKLNPTSKALQSVNIDVCDVTNMYDSLINLVREESNNFPFYEEAALERSTIKNYKTEYERKRTKKRDYEEKMSEKNWFIVSR